MDKETFLIHLSTKLKPIITIIIPIEYLRKCKGAVVQRKLNKIKRVGIKKFDPNRYKTGVNLIGSIQGDFGLGQSCRLVANVLEKADIDYTIYNHFISDVDNMNNHGFDFKISKKLPYNINLIHINPQEMELFYSEMSKSSWDYRYNIAFWLWELEEFPDEWIKYTAFLDEIWTPSEFVSDSIRKKVNIPVNTIPYHISIKTEKEYDRKFFGLPEDIFLFLTMYDAFSVRQRKNPEGVIQAFMAAFSPDNKEVGIVIKVNNASQVDIDIINESLSEYDNVYMITDNLSKEQVDSLLNVVDVFVSLHRAEGFGLVLAEAMLLGTPTIATNWSANIEFMNKDISCLVDYSFLTLDNDIGPYKKGQRWADADTFQAAKYMKKLFKDQTFYNAISESAKKQIASKLSFENSSKLMKDRLSIICESSSDTLKGNTNE